MHDHEADDAKKLLRRGNQIRAKKSRIPALRNEVMHGGCSHRSVIRCAGTHRKGSQRQLKVKENPTARDLDGPIRARMVAKPSKVLIESTWHDRFPKFSGPVEVEVLQRASRSRGAARVVHMIVQKEETQV